MPLLASAAVDVALQIDFLMLQRAPQPFDEDVVHLAPAPVHRRDALPRSAAGKGGRVNWLPWSVLKISGVPWRASASLRASRQKEVSMVLDSRQASTARLAQARR